MPLFIISLRLPTVGYTQHEQTVEANSLEEALSIGKIIKENYVNGESDLDFVDVVEEATGIIPFLTVYTKNYTERLVE